MPLKDLFHDYDASDLAKMNWQIFMTFMGSPVFAKLSIYDRAMIVEYYNYLEKWLDKNWRKEDELKAGLREKN